jgi:hypothetical protein
VFGRPYQQPLVRASAGLNAILRCRTAALVQPRAKGMSYTRCPSIC